MADINALLGAGIGPALTEGAHAGYFAGRGRLEQQQEEQRQQSTQYIPGAIKGDPQALAQLATANAPAANAVGLALSRMDANQRAKAKDGAEAVSRVANGILQADPKDQPALYQRGIEELRAAGHDVSKLGPWDKSTPGMLRYYRGMSQDVLKHDLQMELKKTPPGKNAAAGAGMFDKPSGGGAQIPVPVEPGGAPDKESSLMPGQPAPTQVASYLPPNLQPAPPAAPPVQTAAAPPGVATGQAQAVLASQGAPADAPAPAAPTGPPEGFQAMGHRDAKGTLVPAQINGQPVYRNPQTGEMRLGDGAPTAVAAAPPAEPVPALSSGGTDAQRPGGGLPGPQVAQVAPSAGAPATHAPVSSAPEGIVFENPDPNKYEVARQGGAPYRDKQGDLRLISRTGDPSVKMLILRPREEKATKVQPGDELKIDPNLKGDEVYAALPPAWAAQIKSIAKGDNPIPSAQSRGPYAQAIRNLVFQAEGEGFTDITHATRMATRKSLAGSQPNSFGGALTSQGQLFNHLAEAVTTADDLKNNPYPLANKALNAIGMAQGDPRASNLKTVINRVNGEMEKFFTGGVPTVSGLVEARDELNSAQSPDQIIGAIGKIAKLIRGRQSELSNQINRGLAYPKDSPNRFDIEADLTPEAKANRDYIESRFKTSTEHAEKKYGSGAAPDTGNIPREAQDMLKADPSSRGHFDEIFGPGSAAKILGR